MPSDVFGIVGTTVAGAFRVEAVVAEGGFAVVYRAHHAGFKAPVALKCLKIPQHFTAEERQAFREQFEGEAELLFKLSASIPTVVRPLHVEAVLAPDGSFMPFLALEWLDGETLDRHVERRVRAGEPPPSIEELTRLLTPVAQALERAHHFNGPTGPISIVHRDMKPENLFMARVGGDPVVKILDFGIAKAKSMASQVAGRMSHRENQGESFSPAYAAPEQWVPKRYGQTGPWTDVWGLALTMVELAAGRPVLDGDHAAMMGTTLDEGRRPTPRTEGVAVIDAVEAVFERALAVDPRMRYRDAGVFWRALCTAQGLEDADPPRSRRSGTYGAPPRSRGSVSGLAAIASGAVVGSVDGPGSAATDLDLGRGQDPARAPPLGLPRGAVPAHALDDAGPSGAPELVLELDLPEPRTSARRAASTSSSRGDAGETRSPAPAPTGTASVPRQEGAMAVARGGSAPAFRPRAAGRSVDPPHKLLYPALLVLLGIGMTVGGAAYAASYGEVFMLGPLRLTWIAALLVLGGLCWAAYRLLLEEGE
jgi:eukaryotic-like serine/threonine-protein kinase